MFKKLIIALASVFLLVCIAMPAAAATGTKTLKATYSNIKIIVNGKVINTAEEPFVVNGVTYVPLRVVSSALGAQVDWDGQNKYVIINTKIDEPDEITPIDGDADNNTGGVKDDVSEEIDEATAFANLLIERHGILKGVYFKEFAVTGDNRKVNIDITLDLAENIEAWSALTDKEVTDWISGVIEDVQKAYDKNTQVTGKIIRDKDKLALIEFDKDGDERLKIWFYDGNYRTGVAIKTKLTVEKEYENKRFNVQGIDFVVTSVNYRSDHGTVDVVLSAVKSNAHFDWNNLSTRDTKRAVKEISQTIAEDFKNANLSFEKVNTTFKDKRNRGLGLYIYDVEADKLI